MSQRTISVILFLTILLLPNVSFAVNCSTDCGRKCCTRVFGAKVCEPVCTASCEAVKAADCVRIAAEKQRAEDLLKSIVTSEILLGPFGKVLVLKTLKESGEALSQNPIANLPLPEDGVTPNPGPPKTLVSDCILSLKSNPDVIYLVSKAEPSNWNSINPADVVTATASVGGLCEGDPTAVVALSSAKIIVGAKSVTAWKYKYFISATVTD